MKAEILSYYPSSLCPKAYFKMWFYLTCALVFFFLHIFLHNKAELFHVLSVNSLFSIRI